MAQLSLLQLLINTPLQRGDRESSALETVSTVSPARQTVETVSKATSASITPLKRGVNERKPLAARN